MTYAIKMGILIFPLIAFIFTLPYMIYEYRKYGSINKYRTLIIYTFIFYLLCSYFLVILPLPDINTVSGSRFDRLNLIPFKAIKDFFNESGFIYNDPSTYLKAIKSTSFLVPIFNILMFIPFGIYLHYYFNCNFKKTLLYSFLLSLFFELTQLTGLYFIYKTSYRLCDVDDLIQNSLGGIIGYLIGNIFIKYLPKREKIDEDSYNAGENVSMIRQAFAYTIDFIIISIISNIYIRIFNTNQIITEFIIFFIYYSFFTTCNHGFTIGSKFFKYKIINTKFKLMLRSILMYIELYLLPYLLSYLNSNISNTDNIYILVINLTIVFTIMFYYLIILFKIIFNRKLFYDRKLNTKYINIIGIAFSLRDMKIFRELYKKDKYNLNKNKNIYPLLSLKKIYYL